jgi:hypothetical protein
MRTVSKRRRGRAAALLSIAALAAGGFVATAGVANAAITQGGGANDQGVPTFYRDAQGLALQLCVAPNEVNCEPAVDDHIGVYFAADATAGPLSALYAIEAVQDPELGAIVTNGARFRIESARANTRYTIRDPWGTTNCRTDATGGADCRLESGGEAGTVRAGHVTTFLRAVGRAGGAFVGNADLVGEVTGSPTGFNRVVMTGGGQRFSTNAFSLMGQKLDDTAMSSISTRALEMGRPNRAEPVTRSIRYVSLGTANATPAAARLSGRNPGAFSVRDNCGSVAPGAACTYEVTFRPRQHKNRTVRAVLTIDDNSLAAPRRVSLKGVGLRTR